ncbi:hypothetical protein NYR70_05365 [Actinobacillus equuli subsp. equuli]|uniref:hypothetical protein n=1 Tax=Actinobacillus equuli TaxID=718 RepID=UPI0024426795|nr:hypothetical protein [Actinobacillus equuli]WGE54087.1 hypothetical protein NYR70_05365 [Actinobacillus equuli subsp. equuli]
MLPIIAAAVVVSASVLKAIVSSQVSQGISEGSKTAQTQIHSGLSQLIKSTVIGILINVGIFISSYFISLFISRKFAILLICIVCAESLLKTTYKQIKLIPDYLLFIKLRSFKKFVTYKIENEIQREVSKELRNSNFVTRTLNNLFGSSEREIISDITQQSLMATYQMIVLKTLITLMILIIYFVTFRLFVVPVLIEDSVNLTLNPIKILCYPFAFLIDCILDTDFTNFII